MLPLRTERLTIRPLTPDDREAVFAYRRIPSVSRYLGLDGTDPAKLAAWWDARVQQELPDGTGWFAVVVELQDRIVGDAGLRLSHAPSVAGPTGEREGYLGYAFDPAHEGRGYATETARAMLRLGFDHLGLRRITAEVFGGHDASCHILDTIGMRHEGTHVQKVFNREGGWYDDEQYALLRDEWLGVKATRGDLTAVEVVTLSGSN